MYCCRCLLLAYCVILISLPSTCAFTGCSQRDPKYDTPQVPGKSGNCTQVYYVSKVSSSAVTQRILKKVEAAPMGSASEADATAITLTCDVGKVNGTNMKYMVDSRFLPKHFR
jgi:hypothetical protein